MQFVIKKKGIYFQLLMLLSIYSNHFLMLCNHTGMVVPHVFYSCWKLLAFDQIQHDAYCAMVRRRLEATFKLRPVIPIFERNEMTECPRKPRQPTSIGITWNTNPFPGSRHAVSGIGFSSTCVLPPGFLPRGQSILWGGHSSLNQTMLQCLATYLFE